MNREVNNLYAFGEFYLDVDERILRRGDLPVPLPLKVFETLRLLVEQHGHIITKSEMMERVWADAFVEESNLTQNIYTLRRVLGTDENGQQFIETVARRGYRFVAPVSFVEPNVRDGETLNVRDTETRGSADAETKGDAGTRRRRDAGTARMLSRIAVAAIILVALGIAGFTFYSRSNETRSATPIEKVNFQKLTFTGDLTFPVLAPDGNSFASVRGNQIVVQDVASGEERRLKVEGHTTFGILGFSPDGNSICFRNRAGFDLPGKVFQVSRFGGSPTLIAENVWSGFGFSDDGKRIAFVRQSLNEGESSLIVRNLETGDEHQLASAPAPSRFLDNGHPTWSPDGKKIAVVTYGNAPPKPGSELVVIDADSGAVEEIKQPQLRQFEQVAWLADGKSLIVSARENGKFFQLWRIQYPDGGLQKVTNDLNIYRGVSLSADKTKLLARQFTLYSHLWTGDATDLTNLKQRTFGNLNRDGLGGLTWTHDGDIVYVSRIMGDYDLWRYRPSDDSRRQLTKNSGEFNRYPTASPDARYIFFDSNRTGTPHIWRMDTNAESNQEQITFSEKDNEVFPQVSRDGTWIYYIQRNRKLSSVWRKSLIDDRTEALTDAGKVSPSSFLSVSPDGRFLAFNNAVEQATEDEGPQIYQIGVVATDGRSSPRLFNIAATRLIVKWSADGSALDYIVNSLDAGQIWRQAIPGNQPPILVVDLPKAFLHNFAWSPDGEKLVLSRGQQLNDAILLTNFHPLRCSILFMILV